MALLLRLFHQLRIPAATLGTALVAGAGMPLHGQPAGTDRLTGVIDMYPHPSPDGERVVFQSNRTGDWDVYVLDVTSGAVEGLSGTPGVDEVTPAWSPDGQRVAYVSDASGSFDVWVLEVGRSSPRRVTDYPGSEYHPRWAPDGSRIIFNAPRSTPDPPEPNGGSGEDIFSVRADGSDLRRHTRCSVSCTYPSYSPDGSRIVYREVVEGPGLRWDLTVGEGNSEIIVANVDGSGARSVAQNAAFDGWPSWSPVGETIAFASNRTGPSRTGQIWLVEADGSNLRRVTDGPWSHAQPTWSSAGRSLLVYELQESGDWEAGHLARIPVSEGDSHRGG